MKSQQLLYKVWYSEHEQIASNWEVRLVFALDNVQVDLIRSIGVVPEPYVDEPYGLDLCSVFLHYPKKAVYTPERYLKPLPSRIYKALIHDLKFTNSNSALLLTERRAR